MENKENAAITLRILKQILTYYLEDPKLTLGFRLTFLLDASEFGSKIDREETVVK